jgi:hypothetical protein
MVLIVTMGVFYIYSKFRFTFTPDIMMPPLCENIKYHKFLFGHKAGEIVLTEKNMTAPTYKAYRCKDCRKVIVEERNT